MASEDKQLAGRPAQRPDNFVSLDELGTILESFPDKKEVKQKVVKRMIERGARIEDVNYRFDPFAAVKNAPGSLVDYGKALWQFGKEVKQISDMKDDIKDPMKQAAAGRKVEDFVRGIGGLALGTLLAAVPESIQKKLPRQDKIKQADAIFNEVIAKRYGSADRFLHTMETDPVGGLSDVAGLYGLAGKGVKLAKIPKLAEGLEATAKILDPMTAALKIGQRAAKKVNDAMGTTALLGSKIGERATKFALGITGNEQKKFIGSKNFSQLLNERRISGTMEQVKSQLFSRVEKYKGLVDRTLAGVPGTYRNPVVKKLAEEMSRAFPRKNLSPEFAERAERLLGLVALHEQGGGLLLRELNEFKRLADDLLEVYKPNIPGVPKASNKMKNLSELRHNLKRFIENKAASAGHPEIAQWNFETAFGKTGADILDSKIKATLRSKVGKAAGLVGLGGLAYGLYNPQYLGTIGVVVVGSKLLTSERFLTAVGNRLQALSDAQIRILERTAKLGRDTAEYRKLVRSIYGDMAKVFPGIRITGQEARKEQ